MSAPIFINQLMIVHIHENSEGLSSATYPKPKGLPSQCLLMYTIKRFLNFIALLRHYVI